MSGPIDRELLAERSASVVAHLDRVARHLPADPSELTLMPSATDTGLQADLGERLARAAGFRNLIVHAYARLDLARVHVVAATAGADLLAFLAALWDRAD